MRSRFVPKQPGSLLICCLGQEFLDNGGARGILSGVLASDVEVALTLGNGNACALTELLSRLEGCRHGLSGVLVKHEHSHHTTPKRLATAQARSPLQPRDPALDMNRKDPVGVICD